MPEKMIEITDDSSILITAEFHVAKGSNSESVDIYKIDLIASRNLTLDELISGIVKGLDYKIRSSSRKRTKKQKDEPDEPPIYSTRLEEEKENEKRFKTVIKPIVPKKSGNKNYVTNIGNDQKMATDQERQTIIQEKKQSKNDNVSKAGKKKPNIIAQWLERQKGAYKTHYKPSAEGDANVEEKPSDNKPKAKYVGEASVSDQNAESFKTKPDEVKVSAITNPSGERKEVESQRQGSANDNDSRQVKEHKPDGVPDQGSIQNQKRPLNESDVDNEDELYKRYEAYKDVKEADAQLDSRANVVAQIRKDVKVEDVKTRRYTTYEIDGSIDIYIACARALNKCIKGYKRYSFKEINEKNEGAVVTVMYGSINSNAIPYLRQKNNHSIHSFWLFKADYGDMTLQDLGFMTTTRLVFDPIMTDHTAELFSQEKVFSSNKFGMPFNKYLKKTILRQNDKGETEETEDTSRIEGSSYLYNISDQPLYVLDSEPIHIIPPTDKPQSRQQNVFIAILSPLIMTVSMVSARMLMSQNNMSMIILMVAMLIANVVLISINYAYQAWVSTSSVNKWRQDYEAYIGRELARIKDIQDKDIKILNEMYPAAEGDYGLSKERMPSIVENTLSVQGTIFSRNHEHPDFLSVRVGLSGESSALVPSPFRIEGEKREAIVRDCRYRNIRYQSKMPFRIECNPKKRKAKDNSLDGTEGDLIDLPSDIAKEYGWLRNAPVLLKLRDARSIGIISSELDYDFEPLVSNMILDLCYYQSPDDFQFVILFNEDDRWKERQKMIERYKHMPHCRQLLGNISPFAFSRTGAYMIFNKLLSILNDRAKTEDTSNIPHIVVFVLNEYDLKRHLIAKYLPEYSKQERKNLGITFIFFKSRREELPRYCDQIIKRSIYQEISESLLSPFASKEEMFESEVERWFLLPHVQQVSDANWSNGSNEDSMMYEFVPDQFPDFDYRYMEENKDNYYRAFKILSALHYERIAQSGGMPSHVDLLELYDIKQTAVDGEAELKSKIRNKIISNWEANYHFDEKGHLLENKAIKSLAVPIGKKSKDHSKENIVCLDLHEKADGPHMLVAGMTGSGKTETILTYLIGLCMLYRPEQVNLLLMDMKGAGFVKHLEGIPHVVGTITDVDDIQTDTGMIYMLKRFLNSMQAEVRKRKYDFLKMGVDNIGDYNNAINDIEEHIRRTFDLIEGTEEHAEKEKELSQLKTMPHLFVVVDEFTELMRFTTDKDGVDFKGEITAIARIGRSLGIHIILISQNIENAITPDIRANINARLCLRVSSRQASIDMIGIDLAGIKSMPKNGRAYLLVGGGSRFEYFQSGYSKTSLMKDSKNVIQLTQVSRDGEYQVFYNSEDKKYKSSDKKTRDKKDVSLVSANNTQLKQVSEIIIEACRQKGCATPRQVFMAPLKKIEMFDFDWEKTYAPSDDSNDIPMEENG